MSKQIMAELKRCPFCGFPAMLHKSIKKKHKKFPYIVRCARLTCSARTDRWPDSIGAIAAWNRRADSEHE